MGYFILMRRVRFPAVTSPDPALTCYLDGLPFTLAVPFAPSMKGRITHPVTIELGIFNAKQISCYVPYGFKLGQIQLVQKPAVKQNAGSAPRSFRAGSKAKVKAADRGSPDPEHFALPTVQRLRASPM